jgi:hypothetical protein
MYLGKNPHSVKLHFELLLYKIGRVFFHKTSGHNDRDDARAPTFVSDELPRPGANPTIASYNASVVKIYSAVNSMARF